MASEYPLIDIHCHAVKDAPVAILSLDTHEKDGWMMARRNAPRESSEREEACSRPYFSLGIHPWFIVGQDIHCALEILGIMSENPAMLAIGECGLDKCIATPLDLQIEVLTRQVELAERFGKPLIIHCVRAFNELLQLRKASKADSTWVIHGFNAHPVLAAQLIKHGCYLSFGAALLNPNSHAGKALTLTPADRLFLETDTSELTIGEIYGSAAKMLGIGEDILRRQILINFERVFLQ